MLGWHVPGPYELALSSSSWHEFEHACFLFASLLFWWPVVQPWPSVARWPRWSMVPYLLIGDLQNTILSAILVFSDRVLYPTYAAVPRVFGFSALQDQAAAGAIMWVVGSTAFIVPAVIVAIQCLSKKGASRPITRFEQSEKIVAPEQAHLSRASFMPWLIPAGMPDRTLQATSFVVFFLLIMGCFAWLLSADFGDDEDLAVQSIQQSGSFTVSLLAPRELAVGPNDVSVLVQDRNTREILLDASVDLAASTSGTQSPVKVHASSQGSQNKLLQSAQLNLPANRTWELLLAVRHGSEQADFSFPLKVSIAESAIETPWATLAFVGLGLLLLLVYFRRHRQVKNAPLDTSISSV